MCVIAAKPANVAWLGVENMKSCFESNPDGAGIAWVNGKGLHVKKGYFVWEDLYHDLQVVEEYPVLLHCRLATHGSICRKNCHPFWLKNGIAMAHNGVIEIDITRKNMTDSEAFGRRFLENFSIDQLEMPCVAELLESYIGDFNKIAMLKPDGDFIILNECYGVVHEGIWFSNASFMTAAERDRAYYGRYSRYLDDIDDPFFALDRYVG